MWPPLTAASGRPVAGCANGNSILENPLTDGQPWSWLLRVTQTETQDPARVILDPSFLFTEEALDWLGDPEIRASLVISNSLMDLLSDPGHANLWIEFESYPAAEGLPQLIEALGPVARFSFRDTELPNEALAIRDRLLNEGPLGEVFADEWVFLTTQSIGVVAATSARTLGAFARAGGQIFELTEDAVNVALSAVRRRLPSWLRTGMKRIGRFPHRVVPKILIFGGSIAAVIVPAVGLPLNVVGLVQQGAAIIAGDP
jgi:hypothetical protein